MMDEVTYYLQMVDAPKQDADISELDRWVLYGEHLQHVAPRGTAAKVARDLHAYENLSYTPETMAKYASYATRLIKKFGNAAAVDAAIDAHNAKRAANGKSAQYSLQKLAAVLCGKDKPSTPPAVTYDKAVNVVEKMSTADQRKLMAYLVKKYS
jgi:hypothetical protein